MPHLALSRTSPLAVVLLLTFASLGIHPPAALAQDDASRFAEIIAARNTGSSLAGPFRGELTQEVGASDTAAAGITAEEFSATATFVNPVEPSATPWDIGVVFHIGPESTQAIVVDSAGYWYYAPFPGGVLASGATPGVVITPGGANTLDVIVEGSTALFGVNGEFVTRIDLPPAVASDVEFGTGLFSNTVETGRVIGVRDFEVWALPGQSDPSPTATPNLPFFLDEPETGVTPEATAPADPAAASAQSVSIPAISSEPASTVSEADSELFASVLADQAGVTPFIGPFTANLKEIVATVAASWAGLSLDSFQAHAEFDVPVPASDVPWDIGFIFGTSPAGNFRIATDSLGGTWFNIGTGDPRRVATVNGLNTAAGDTNTLDLLVAGQRAFFGVNGALVVTVDLPADTSAADVAAGSAFYADQTLPDRVTRFHEFVILPLAPDALGTATVASSDREQFLALLAEVDENAAAAGPLSGSLIEATVGTAPVVAAGVALADFGASARFVNPADPSQGLWDAGFQFRYTATERSRIVVDSLGDVYATLPGQGSPRVASAATYDDSPGATNTLHLFVMGDRALFGVNGEFVVAVDLPDAPATSDVLAGSGFFNEDFVVGRTSEYQDFRVWDIP